MGLLRILGTGAEAGIIDTGLQILQQVLQFPDERGRFAERLR
jgi:hypothetical protein